MHKLDRQRIVNRKSQPKHKINPLFVFCLFTGYCFGSFLPLQNLLPGIDIKITPPPILQQHYSN